MFKAHGYNLAEWVINGVEVYWLALPPHEAAVTKERRVSGSGEMLWEARHGQVTGALPPFTFPSFLPALSSSFFPISFPRLCFLSHFFLCEFSVSQTSK